VLRLVSWILEPTSGFRRGAVALAPPPLVEFARRRVPRESWAETGCGSWPLPASGAAGFTSGRVRPAVFAAGKCFGGRGSNFRTNNVPLV